MKTTLILIISLFIVIFGTLMWSLSGKISSTVYQRGQLEKKLQKKAPLTNERLHLLTANIGFAGGLTGLDGIETTKEISKARLTEWISNLPKNIDVLVVQEIDQNSKRSGFHNQIQFIANALQFEYVAIAYTWNKKWIPYPLNQPFKKQFGPTVTGQVIYSRYPIRYHKIHRYKKPKELPFWKKGHFIDRVTQYIQITHPTLGDITLAHTHMEAFYPETRDMQLNQTLKTLTKDGKPTQTIVIGDFNINFDHPLPKRINETLWNQFTEIGTLTKIHPTFPCNKPTERIDTLIISNDWHLKSARTLDTPALKQGDISDHLPVYAILEKKKGNKNE